MFLNYNFSLIHTTQITTKKKGHLPNKKEAIQTYIPLAEDTQQSRERNRTVNPIFFPGQEAEAEAKVKRRNERRAAKGDGVLEKAMKCIDKVVFGWKEGKKET